MDWRVNKGGKPLRDEGDNGKVYCRRLACQRKSSRATGLSMEKKSMKESVFARNVHVLALEG